MLSTTLGLLALAVPFQDRQVVSIEPAEAARPALDQLLAIHDVSQLTGHAQLARRAATLALEPAGDAARAAADFEELERLRSQSELKRDGLLQVLRAGLRPAMDAATRLEWLEGGRIALLGSPQQQAWLETWLAQARPFDGLIEVRTVLWSLPRTAEVASWTARNRERLSPAALAELQARLEALGAQRISAPNLLCFPFASAELRAGSELPYVSDWEFLELADRDDRVPSPVIARTFEGFEVNVRCAPAEAGRLRLEVEARHTTIRRPLTRYETTLGHWHEPLVVQLAEWTTVQVRGDVELADDETLILAAEDEAGDRVVLALVGARSVPALDAR
jgi:hypothetical protein